MAIDNEDDRALRVGVIVLSDRRSHFWRFAFLSFSGWRRKAFGYVQKFGDVFDRRRVILAPNDHPNVDQVAELLACGKILTDPHLVLAHAEFQAFTGRAVNIAAMELFADINAVR